MTSQPPPYGDPYYYPPVHQQPAYVPPPDPNKGIRTAGTVAIWVWIVLTLLPLLLGLACVGFCCMGGIFGAANPDPSSTR